MRLTAQVEAAVEATNIETIIVTAQAQRIAVAVLIERKLVPIGIEQRLQGIVGVKAVMQIDGHAFLRTVAFTNER